MILPLPGELLRDATNHRAIIRLDYDAQVWVGLRWERDRIPVDEQRGTTVTWSLPAHVPGTALRDVLTTNQPLLDRVARGLQFWSRRGQIHATLDADGLTAYHEVEALLAPLAD